MSRLLLLSILVLWMLPRQDALAVPGPLAARVGMLIGVYALLVGLMSLWSRMLARRVADDWLGRTLDRYNKATELARYFIPVWYAVGLFVLGWGDVVYQAMAWLDPAEAIRQVESQRGRLTPGESISPENYWRLPALLLGVLPALLAWMGLWWAQFPADRALKEQSVLYRANEGLPIHAPPSFGTFFLEHFRQQVLFTLAPVLFIVVSRDLLALGWAIFADAPMTPNGGDWVVIPIAVVMFVVAPEILRRLIPTRPLPPAWPLRQRLEGLCVKANLRVRDILVWHTNGSVGNAMVMGLFPRVRYIFLSDLLIETMTDEEIEAVFAHEIGHVVHRHMWWYVAFVGILMLMTMGPVAVLMEHVPGLSFSLARTEAARRSVEVHQAQAVSLFGFGLFAVAFGFLSRRFERQADVYAARAMQATRGAAALPAARPGAGAPPVVIRHVNPDLGPGGVLVGQLAGAAAGGGGMPAFAEYPGAYAGRGPTGYGAGNGTGHGGGRGAGGHADLPGGGPSYVGRYGATVVAGALNRVARVNNIPVAAHEWLHGSIERRMRYLHELSADSSRTRAFDKHMRRFYWGLLSVLVTLAAWVGVQAWMVGVG